MIDILVTLTDSMQGLPQKDGKVRLTFKVIDHACGMTKDDQERLFRPFMQIRPGELQKGRGSGLGLSICKTIVDLHGGIIGCNSKKRVGDDMNSGGSEFFFTIAFDQALGMSMDENLTTTSDDDSEHDCDSGYGSSKEDNRFVYTPKSGRASKSVTPPSGLMTTTPRAELLTVATSLSTQLVSQKSPSVDVNNETVKCSPSNESVLSGSKNALTQSDDGKTESNQHPECGKLAPPVSVEVTPTKTCEIVEDHPTISPTYISGKPNRNRGLETPLLPIGNILVCDGRYKIFAILIIYRL